MKLVQANLKNLKVSFDLLSKKPKKRYLGQSSNRNFEDGVVSLKYIIFILQNFQ